MNVFSRHNGCDAIAHGNRLIMLQDGHVVVDVEGEAKQKLTVEDLLKLFAQPAAGNSPATGQSFPDPFEILMKGHRYDTDDPSLYY